MQLVWFRSDLRIYDNKALSAAMQSGPTLALYVITPEQWRLHDDAACKVDFWLRNLKHLQQALSALNVPLLIRYADYWSELPQVLVDVCVRESIGALHVNDEYGVNEQRRDEKVRQQLQAHGITVHRYMDQLLFAPGSIQTRSGTMPKVFSQFRKLCLARWAQVLPSPIAAPKAQAPLARPTDLLPQAIPGFAAPNASLQAHWPAGERHAQARLEQFADEVLQDYHILRDVPAKTGTSGLSPYLAAGVLSPRQCVQAALLRNHGEYASGNEGVTTWITELLWRDFYKHILVAYPKVSKHRAFREPTERIKWRVAPEELLAWQQGRTGIVLVDAAMRQLAATGWMHNRLRMVVAMFLSKNLLLDWREGERFFMQHLIDGDLAANNGGWQWSASTGTDSVPYFRLFNPISQAKRFDPDGEFIRRWLPEIAHLSTRELFNPHLSGGLFVRADYPAPIVDLAASRTRALEAFSGQGARADEY